MFNTVRSSFSKLIFSLFNKANTIHFITSSKIFFNLLHEILFIDNFSNNIFIRCFYLKNVFKTSYSLLFKILMRLDAIFDCHRSSLSLFVKNSTSTFFTLDFLFFYQDFICISLKYPTVSRYIFFYKFKRLYISLQIAFTFLKGFSPLPQSLYTIFKSLKKLYLPALALLLFLCYTLIIVWIVIIRVSLGALTVFSLYSFFFFFWFSMKLTRVFLQSLLLFVYFISPLFIFFLFTLFFYIILLSLIYNQFFIFFLHKIYTTSFWVVIESLCSYKDLGMYAETTFYFIFYKVCLFISNFFTIFDLNTFIKGFFTSSNIEYFLYPSPTKVFNFLCCFINVWLNPLVLLNFYLHILYSLFTFFFYFFSKVCILLSYPVFSVLKLLPFNFNISQIFNLFYTLYSYLLHLFNSFSFLPSHIFNLLNPSYISFNLYCKYLYAWCTEFSVFLDLYHLVIKHHITSFFIFVFIFFILYSIIEVNELFKIIIGFFFFVFMLLFWNLWDVPKIDYNDWGFLDKILYSGIFKTFVGFLETLINRVSLCLGLENYYRTSCERFSPDKDLTDVAKASDSVNRSLALFLSEVVYVIENDNAVYNSYITYYFSVFTANLKTYYHFIIKLLISYKGDYEIWQKEGLKDNYVSYVFNWSLKFLTYLNSLYTSLYIFNILQTVNKSNFLSPQSFLFDTPFSDYTDLKYFSDSSTNNCFDGKFTYSSSFWQYAFINSSNFHSSGSRLGGAGYYKIDSECKPYAHINWPEKLHLRLFPEEFNKTLGDLKNPELVTDINSWEIEDTLPLYNGCTYWLYMTNWTSVNIGDYSVISPSIFSKQSPFDKTYNNGNRTVISQKGWGLLNVSITKEDVLFTHSEMGFKHSYNLKSIKKGRGAFVVSKYIEASYLAANNACGSLKSSHHNSGFLSNLSGLFSDDPHPDTVLSISRGFNNLFNLHSLVEDATTGGITESELNSASLEYKNTYAHIRKDLINSSNRKDTYIFLNNGKFFTIV